MTIVGNNNHVMPATIGGGHRRLIENYEVTLLLIESTYFMEKKATSESNKHSNLN